MRFAELIKAIRQVDTGTKLETGKAINRLLTSRNWLIGWYIAVYEQNGDDRAEYGERLIDSLSAKLNSKSFSPANLKYFRQFYRVYPQIGQSLIDQFKQLNISQSLIGKLPGTVITENEISDAYGCHFFYFIGFWHSLKVIELQLIFYVSLEIIFVSLLC